MSVWQLPVISVANGYQFDVVAKGVRMRAAAHLLKSAPVIINRGDEAGWQNKGKCTRSVIRYALVQLPRGISSQIQMLIQKRCGELEKELLRYLQRSIFDPCRCKSKAAPNYLVLILLLSTYSFLGVKSWVRPLPEDRYSANNHLEWRLWWEPRCLSIVSLLNTRRFTKAIVSAMR